MTESNCCNQPQNVYDAVREGYSKIARKGVLFAGTSSHEASGCCGPSSCCGASWSPDQLAEKIGYSADQLSMLPEGANMGLSCGNPTAIASLQPGQVVLDLGSGGGFDCFLAGPKVGAEGCVIGVDMTPDMLSKARSNIGAYRERTGLDNVEFRLGEIEHLPVADASVDVVISNCVINLSPDKPQVWHEITRVLKPGGTVAVSDIALLRPLPEKVQSMVAALVGCVAGAVLVDDYRRMITSAGLIDVQLKEEPEYIATLSQFEDPLYKQIAEHLPSATNAADFITSVSVKAKKG